MIRFGLHLTLRGGREAATRLILIASAVALGVTMLLTTLAGISAVNKQNARYAWLQTGNPAVKSDNPVARADPVWWLLTADRFDGKVIGRVDVAATGPNAPVPPGIPALPGPGQFYASPAMRDLLASTPFDELAARYPGTEVGSVGDAALPAPNSLIIIVGHAPEQLAHVPGARRVTSIATTTPRDCTGACASYIGINARGIDLVLSVVTAALLFPLLIFIGTATRLSAARREQRFAAMRLVGATPHQVTVISGVESTVAAVTGVAAGFGLFYALRPLLAPIPFTGAPFFLGDLSLNLADVLLVALAIPVGAALAAALALRRVNISPLGVSRRVTPAAPSAWRLLPLPIGLGELAYFVMAGRPSTTGGQILGFLSGILVTMVGLVIAGPWLTMTGSRLLARRAHRPPALIAARRLADNPQAGFRAVSGLVLALFVTSTAIGLITTITAYDGGARSTPAQRATLVQDFFRTTRSGYPLATVPSVPAALLDELRATPGVTAAVLVHAPTGPEFPPGLISCADLARVPALGRCAPGASIVTIEPDLAGSKFGPQTWPPAAAAPDRLTGMRVRTLVVATDGSGRAIERARTIVARAYPDTDAPATVAEQRADQVALADAYRQLANVVIIASLPIAGCTLAVSVVAGLNERRRPFSLLRLTGVPLRTLRRVVLLESAVPLLVAAAVSVAAGFLAAYLFLRSQLFETLQAPGPSFYALVLAGIAASLAIIASTLPALRRISGPETARND